MRTATDIMAVSLRAQLRRERRVRAVARLRDMPALLRGVALVHEATALIDRLNAAALDRYDAASEKYQERG